MRDVRDAIALAFFLMGLAFLMLPSTVNAAAYLTGTGPSVTFVPVSYHQWRSHSSSGAETSGTDTVGYLEPGEGNAIWPDQVPIGKPFKVRAPVLTYGFLDTNLNDTESAIGAFIFGGMFVILGTLAAIVCVALFCSRLWWLCTLPWKWFRHGQGSGTLAGL